jgi:tetratricopeptide (TPR) repeat protein
MKNIKNINPNDRKIWFKAIDLALNGRFKESLALYEKLLNKYSLNVNLNYEASLIYIKDIDYYKAYDCMERIFESFQDNINYLNDFSVVCAKLSYLEKAEYLSKRAFLKEPTNANHLINLSGIYISMGNFEKAIEVIGHAIEIDPMEPHYYNLLGVTLTKSGLSSIAEKMFITAITLDENYIESIVNLAVIESKKGSNLKSIALLEDALNKRNKNTNINNMVSINVIKYLLCFDLLAVGRLKDGWLYYDNGFDLDIELKSRRSPVRIFKKPRWNGVVNVGKTILIWREQGIGDEIMFYTCLPDLIKTGMKVIVECEERLVGVLSRSFPQVVIRKENFNLMNSKNPTSEDFDYNLPVGSLMRYFRDDIAKFNSIIPIFKINEELASRHELNLTAVSSSKNRIGICWRSGDLNMQRNEHYLTIEDLFPILENENYDFINLQYDECEEELLLAEKSLNINIIRWDNLDLKNDLDSVLALISRLDLVITVGTAVSSLAGIIGKKQLLIDKKSWCNLGTDHFPFFPSCEYFGPSENEMLSECVPRVHDRLKQILM